MDTSRLPMPRLVRPVDEPLGLYLKPGRNDHRVISQLLSEERVAMSGVIFDPEYTDTQEELRSDVRQRNLDAVLDPRVMELATPAGATSRRATLPWGSSRPHTLTDLAGSGGAGMVEAVAEFVTAKRFTSVLTPTHFLAEGARDPWFELDRSLVRKLRDRLDALGASDVAIYYPLAVPTSVFFDQAHRTAIKAAFQGIPIDAIWLRIHPFGSDSGHLTLQRYIAACRDFHGLSLPLVAERTGNIGLALLAFGGVGGIESGVSSGERFDFRRLTRKQGKKQGFAPHQRVYIPTLGIFLAREPAERFFDNRTLRANFACENTECCRRGAADMVSNPRRHFVFTRMEEARMISRVPPRQRPEEYLNNLLRPATDRLGRASRLVSESAIRDRLEAARLRLDGWRYTLGEMARMHPPVTYSAVPLRRVLRQRRGA